MDDVYEKVVKICHNRLKENQEALSYLKNRNLTDETIERYEFGLFPQDLREFFDIVEPIHLRKVGIIHNVSSSVFKTRDIVFPIKDVYDNYIAIAGRTRLTDDARSKKDIPKYINTRYPKSTHLFGLNNAKQDIIEKEFVYVVEGYFDVIMSHQKGINNVVAVCCSNLSTRQIGLLSRYTDKIIIIFDNEEKAQERAKIIAEKKKFKGIIIEATNPFKNTKFKDIDEYLSGHSVKDFMSAIENKREDYASIKTLW